MALRSLRQLLWMVSVFGLLFLPQARAIVAPLISAERQFLVPSAQTRTTLMRQGIGSDALDPSLEVSLVEDGTGAKTVWVRSRASGRGLTYSGTILIADTDKGLYYAVNTTGGEADAERLRSAIQSSGRTPPSAESLRRGLHAVWLRQQQLVADDQRRVMKILSGGEARPNPLRSLQAFFLQPDGSADEIEGATPFGCPGYGRVEIDWMDPVNIVVNYTTYLASWDSTDYPTNEGSTCWNKDAAGYWWPADTQWYTDQCSDVGWGTRYEPAGFDHQWLGRYHNNDWGDDELETWTRALTGIIHSAGYGNTEAAIGYDSGGEDSGMLHTWIYQSIYSGCLSGMAATTNLRR